MSTRPVTQVLLAGAHVLIGAAVALPVVALVALFASAVATGSASDRLAATVAVVGLALLTLGVVTAVLTAPGVKALEIVAARALLGAELPDARHPREWPTRRQGLWWALTVMVLGTVGVAVLLVGIPTGVALFVPANPEDTTGILPTTAVPLRALAGVGAILLAIAVFVGIAELQRRLAPAMLAPTAADQIDELRSANVELTWRTRLAHDLHDSIGHTLTAMTVQAQAARAVSREPNRHLDAVEELGKSALSQLDGTINRLTADSPEPGENPDWRASIRSMTGLAGATLVESNTAPQQLSSEVADSVTDVVREALTNALRHGNGDVTVELGRVGGDVELVVHNRVARAATRAGHGMGLTTMRARTDRAGGTIAIESDDERWAVRASFPIEVPS